MKLSSLEGYFMMIVICLAIWFIVLFMQFSCNCMLLKFCCIVYILCVPFAFEYYRIMIDSYTFIPGNHGWKWKWVQHTFVFLLGYVVSRYRLHQSWNHTFRRYIFQCCDISYLSWVILSRNSFTISYHIMEYYLIKNSIDLMRNLFNLCACIIFFSNELSVR